MIIKSVAYQDLYKLHPTLPSSEDAMTLSVVAIARGTSAGPSGMGSAGFLSGIWDFSSSVVSAPAKRRTLMRGCVPVLAPARDEPVPGSELNMGPD